MQAISQCMATFCHHSPLHTWLCIDGHVWVCIFYMISLSVSWLSVHHTLSELYVWVHNWPAAIQQLPSLYACKSSILTNNHSVLTSCLKPIVHTHVTKIRAISLSACMTYDSQGLSVLAGFSGDTTPCGQHPKLARCCSFFFHLTLVPSILSCVRTNLCIINTFGFLPKQAFLQKFCTQSVVAQYTTKYTGTTINKTQTCSVGIVLN